MTQMNLFGENATLKDVVRERRNDVAIIKSLQSGKLQGRIRTLTRAVPANATDVTEGDAEGDVIVDATYRYELVSVSGVLKWNRQSLSVGW